MFVLLALECWRKVKTDNLFLFHSNDKGRDRTLLRNLPRFFNIIMLQEHKRIRLQFCSILGNIFTTLWFWMVRRGTWFSCTENFHDSSLTDTSTIRHLVKTELFQRSFISLVWGEVRGPFEFLYQKNWELDSRYFSFKENLSGQRSARTNWKYWRLGGSSRKTT